jgi:AcrR family transcriptional regulator
MTPLPVEGVRVAVRRSGTPGPRGGGVYLSRVQQTRLLDAAVAVVAGEGLGRLSARRVAARAGMSTKTFYDLFEDSEDCFLAVFDRAVDRLTAVLAPAWAGEGEWVQRVRGAVVALLGCLESEPAVARIVFLEALAAGPRVLACRAEVLDRVAGLIDEGRAAAPFASELPSLTAAGVAGAAFSVIHARLVEQPGWGGASRSRTQRASRATHASDRGRRPIVRDRPTPPIAALGSLLELAAPLMATIVLPYRGREASARELARPVPAQPEPAMPSEGLSAAAGDALVPVRVRPPRRGRPVRPPRPGAKRRAIHGGALLAGTDAVEYRRVLLLRAAAAAVDEHGYGAVTVAHITTRVKISRRTFYELFDDREQCLLAVMQDIDTQLTAELRTANLEGLEWRERVRLGLWTVLRFFDREPTLARFCVIESARGDDRMFAHREELLTRITAVIAEGSEESLLGESSPLTAQGIAGAIVSILNTRLAATGRRVAGRSRKSTGSTGSLSGLLGELMALIVLPYLGAGLAQEERARPEPRVEGPAERPGRSEDDSRDSREGGASRSRTQGAWRASHASDRGRRDAPPIAPVRMTYRTALALEAIAQTPGISNLGVARHAQINDQGQVSKLLSRLERHGLVQNTGRGQTQGAPNEWRLTPTGQQVEQSIRERPANHRKQAA